MFITHFPQKRMSFRCTPVFIKIFFFLIFRFSKIVNRFCLYPSRSALPRIPTACDCDWNFVCNCYSPFRLKNKGWRETRRRLECRDATSSAHVCACHRPFPGADRGSTPNRAKALLPSKLVVSLERSWLAGRYTCHR